ncbi:MAG: hypothetical protein M1834_007525 [Cirrosporium novae-zelandiae]|nr:MAG: hypothetical protein M1834_007525 [Cirrosporium novae-zelandiae]
MGSISQKPLHIAILINTFPSPLQLHTITSFSNILKAVSPSAKVTFFDPIEKQSYPDLSDKYDAVILSGGTTDINGDNPWVLKMLKFLRRVCSEEGGQTKIIGICWGHQALNMALGGTVKMMGEEGPEIGVTTIPLTPLGQNFFPFTTITTTSSSLKPVLNMHEFHRRIVAVPALHMQPLAENHQIFLRSDNRILTFQGHPEMTTELAKMILENASEYTEGMDGGALKELKKKMEKESDGVEIWRRVVEWIGKA